MEIVRNYFKKTRQRNDYKISTVSSILNIPQSYISQWENNKRDLSSNIVTSMFSLFDIDYQEAINSYNTNVDIYNNLLLELCYMRESPSNLLLKLKSPRDNSLEYSYYLVLKLLFNSSSKKAINLKPEIDSNLQLLTPPHKVVYYFALGCYYYIHSEKNLAIEYYQKALSFGPLKFITSLVYYNLSSIYCAENKYLYSLTCLEKSIQEFQREVNLKRIIAAYNTKGLILMFSNSTKKAKEEYLRLLRITNFFNEHYLDRIIINNLVLTLIDLEEYSSAYKYSMDLIDIFNQKTAVCYFYAIWSSYKNGFNDESLHLISIAQNYCLKNDFHNELIELTRQYILKEKVGSQLVKCYRMINSKGTIIMKVFILKLLIEFHIEAPSKKSLRSALKYYQELSSLLAEH